MSQKVLILSILERVEEFALTFIENFISVPGRPVPYIYKPKKDQIIWPLKYFSTLSDSQSPYIISVGPGNIGKSSLLN